MDGASVVGHYIVASTTTAGYGHDSGYTVNSPPPPPSSGCLEYLGIVTTAASGAGQIGDFNASNPFRPCASIVGATSPITISSGLVQLNNSSGTGVTNVPDIQYAPADTIVTTTSGMSTGCISTINIIKPTAATHYACKFDVSQTVASAGCTTQATIANQLNWIDNFSGLTVSGNNNIIMANSTLGSTSLANANLTSEMCIRDRLWCARGKTCLRLRDRRHAEPEYRLRRATLEHQQLPGHNPGQHQFLCQQLSGELQHK